MGCAGDQKSGNNFYERFMEYVTADLLCYILPLTSIKEPLELFQLTKRLY